MRRPATFAFEQSEGLEDRQIPALMENERRTRDRILDVAEAAILEKGFAATSIDELIVRVFATWWHL
jgi:AcrR family transcriptional regulator